MNEWDVYVERLEFHVEVLNHSTFVLQVR